MILKKLGIIKNNSLAYIICASVLLATETQASIVQLSSAEFSTNTSSLLTTVEDFENITTGTKSNPFSFVNGTFTSDTSSPSIASISTFCGNAADLCLTSQVSADTRTIDALPSGTNYWGVDMHFIEPSDIIDVTVIGASGSLHTQTTSTSFYGFYDPLGIISIQFTNLGNLGGAFSNYSFDNITTSSVVPVPAAALLFGSGLLGLVGLARRKA